MTYRTAIQEVITSLNCIRICFEGISYVALVSGDGQIANAPSNGRLHRRRRLIRTEPFVNQNDGTDRANNQDDQKRYRKRF